MTNEIPPEQASDPTFKKYYLSCVLKYFDKKIDEDIGKGKRAVYDRKLVLLVPEENDEFYRFCAAWVPQVPTEHYELAAIIGSPVNSPVRLSVHMRDERCDRPYLFLMSKGIEDLIVARLQAGARLRVTTLPANEIEMAEQAQDVSDGNFEVIK